jgi:hypothetical protein
MDKMLQAIHRTWVQELIERDREECAALIVDAELGTFSDYGSVERLVVTLPRPNYRIVENESVQNILEDSFCYVAFGHLELSNSFHISYRMKLAEVEDNWQNIIKRLIVSSSKGTKA